MPSLETTNWILAVIAAATAAQFLMLFIGALWVAKRIAGVQETVTKTLERFEATYVPELSAKVSGLVDDLHSVAERMDRVGAEVERATRIAQGALSLAGNEVERATRGVRFAFDVMEGGARQAARVSAGVKAGLIELFGRRSNGGRDRNRLQDEDAIARFEAGA
ncbi:MAG TPA: hypothetical protein VFD69_10665 [Vicinamibacterales bacterium]|nr:hypothetical protein [Vicinamibacterales bacterium]